MAAALRALADWPWLAGRVAVWVVARRLRPASPVRWPGDTAACRSYTPGGCAGGRGYAHWRRRWTPVCPKRRCLCLARHTIRLLQLTGGGVAVYFPTLLRWYSSTGPTATASGISRVTDHSPLSRRIALSIHIAYPPSCSCQRKF